MMMESFTGMMLRDDTSLRRMRGVSCPGRVLRVRLGAPPVGMGRFRSLPPAGAHPRRGQAVPDDGSAVGLRLLRGSVLQTVRRSPSGAAARAGPAERLGAVAHLPPGARVDRPAGGD